MGHKVNPKIFRIGRSQEWSSKWFSRKNFSQQLQADHKIRKHIQAKLKTAGVSKIEIERPADEVKVIIHTAKPGVVIGRGGAGVQDLKKEIIDKFLADKKNVNLVIKEVDKPRLDAQLILQEAIEQVEKRMRYRRVMKQVVRQTMEAGAKGVKIRMAGRLNGVEIARREVLSEGRLPLHTIRADIDYARGNAHTTYGVIGIKVWVYRGDVFEKNNKETKERINEGTNK